MEQEISVREWQKQFKLGEFSQPDVKTQIKAGWYDWFCKETSLVGKTQRMGSIVKQVKDGGKVNLDTMYVWFKNNCLMSGGLYDDFRFADIETGTTMMTIQINCCWNEKRYTVFARKSVDIDMDCKEPEFESNSSKELVAWLNTPWEETKSEYFIFGLAFWKDKMEYDEDLAEYYMAFNDEVLSLPEGIVYIDDEIKPLIEEYKADFPNHLKQ